jgi:hypothetical protein
MAQAVAARHVALPDHGVTSRGLDTADTDSSAATLHGR